MLALRDSWPRHALPKLLGDERHRADAGDASCPRARTRASPASRRRRRGARTRRPASSRRGLGPALRARWPPELRKTGFTSSRYQSQKSFQKKRYAACAASSIRNVSIPSCAATHAAAKRDPASLGAVLAAAALVVGGTVLPFTLFAYGQTRVSAEMTGAFLNLEPLVGAMAGVLAFGDPAGPEQVAGGTAILAGIALSSLPLLGQWPPHPATEAPRTPTEAPHTGVPTSPRPRPAPVSGHARMAGALVHGSGRSGRSRPE